MGAFGCRGGLQDPVHLLLASLYTKNILRLQVGSQQVSWLCFGPCAGAFVPLYQH